MTLVTARRARVEILLFIFTGPCMALGWTSTGPLAVLPLYEGRLSRLEPSFGASQLT
jgi:hypothetical protein